MAIHKSVTVARAMRAVKRASETLDNPGFCLACGKSVDGCEPDLRNGTCEHCGAKRVFGTEEVLMMVGF